MSFSFRRRLTTPFTTKRRSSLGPGRTGPYEPHLIDAAQRCTPIDPADGDAAREVALRLSEALKAPYRIYECFVSGDVDIAEGDLLCSSGREYPIRQINRWEWRSGVYLHLLFEGLNPLATAPTPTSSALLREDGGYILREDGGRILRETT